MHFSIRLFTRFGMFAGKALLVLSTPSILAASLAQGGDIAKAEVIRAMDARAEHFKEVSRRIWEHPELSFEEFRSSALLAAELRAAGFRVTTNIAAIPTAFVAEWGGGKPVIALLGEYDALPDLSQETIPERKAGGAGGPGHGCGHNLLGTASAFAAIAAKDFMMSHKLGGTIRFYGCPAEENGAGKLFMIRAGAFADCDVALTWHPDDRNEPGMRSTLANQGAYFRFHGIAAHAGRAPEKGRSALDAVMVMTHAVDLLREHVPSAARMHYIITQGGTAVNVVPELAELRLVARHPDVIELDKIWARIVKCADAGALATETRLEVEFTGGLANVVPNDTLAALFEGNMRLVGGVRYTEDERVFAEKLRASLPPDGLPALEIAAAVQSIQTAVTSWSTDVGDVSWTIPTGEIRAAAFVPGVAPHTWQSTACSGMGIGQKAMIVAAKTLALTAIELLHDPRQVEAARRSFDKYVAGKKYISKLPMDAKPQNKQTRR